jgi:hypothetical protein
MQTLGLELSSEQLQPHHALRRDPVPRAPPSAIPPVSPVTLTGGRAVAGDVKVNEDTLVVLC